MTPVRAAARRLSSLPERHDHPDVHRPRHLRPVREEPGRNHAPPRRRSVFGLTRKGTALCVLVFVGMLSLAAFHAVLVQGQIRLDGLDEAVAAQQEEYHRARLEVARLEAPERVVQEAMTRLGMVAPTEVVHLTPAEAHHDGPPVDPAADDADHTWLEVKPYLERNP